MVTRSESGPPASKEFEVKFEKVAEFDSKVKTTLEGIPMIESALPSWELKLLSEQDKIKKEIQKSAVMFLNREVFTDFKENLEMKFKKTPCNKIKKRPNKKNVSHKHNNMILRTSLLLNSWKI